MLDIPSGVATLVSQTYRKVDYSQGEPRLLVLSGADKTACLEHMSKVIFGYLSRAASVVTSDKVLAYSHGYIYSDGTTDAPPPPVVDFIHDKVGVSHKEFKKRVLRGEIMMSNYTRYSIRIRRSYGFKSTKDLTVSKPLNLTPLIEDGTLVRTIDYRGREFLAIAGTSWASETNKTVAYYDRRVTDGEWFLPPFMSAVDVLAVMRQFPDPCPLVTRTTAIANRRSLDFLTAAAEMPETVKSVISGFSLVAKIVKDFKKGEVDVTKAFARRKRVITDRYNKRLARIENQLLNPKLTPERRADLLKHRSDVTLRKRTTLSDSAQEFADAMADLWLNFRYNIMPNVYLLEDIEKAVNRLDNEFITARSKSVFDVRLSGDGWGFDIPVIQRCVIKRRFNLVPGFFQSHQISNSLFVTAWELVTLSFVIDWFVNIGDVLASLSFKQDWEAEGATLSHLVKFSETVNLFPDQEYAIDPIVQIDGVLYDRKNINPSDYIGFVWQPKLGLERKIDAIALLWRPVRSQLKR